MKKLFALVGLLVVGGLNADDLRLTVKAPADNPTEEMTCQNGDYEVRMCVMPQPDCERVRVMFDVMRNGCLVCKPEVEMCWNDCANLCMQDDNTPSSPLNMVLTLERCPEPCLEMEMVTC